MGNCLQRLRGVVCISTPPKQLTLIPVVLKNREHEVGSIISYIPVDEIIKDKETQIIRDIWSGKNNHYWDETLQGYTNFINLTVKEFAVVKEWIVDTQMGTFSLNLEEWNNVYCSGLQNGLLELTNEIQHQLVMNPYDDCKEIYDWDVIYNSTRDIRAKVKIKWQLTDTVWKTKKLVHIRRRKIPYVPFILACYCSQYNHNTRDIYLI